MPAWDPTSWPGMFTSMLDGIKSGMLNRVLVNVGQLLNEGAKDPDMPDWVQEGIDAAHGTLWDSVCREIKEDVMFQCSYKDADFRESMMLFRAQPPSWRREPFVWFRAKVLHTLMPSDGTIWTTVRDPICWAVRVAFVLPVVGSISYVGMFFLIRKTDEYQLINYIVQAKALQSLCVGVPALIQAGIKMWSCLNVLDAITVTADGRVVDEVVDAVVTRGPCTTEGPGNSPLEKAILLVEPLKMATTWVAFVLLVNGYATGGREKLHALERVRVDAADGKLDGRLDYEAAEAREEMQQIERRQLVPQGEEQARARGAARGGAARGAPPHGDDADGGERGRLQRLDGPDEEAMRTRVQALLAKEGVRPRRGKYIPYFMVYDGCVLGLVFSLFGIEGMVDSHSHGWMTWASLYYANVLYSLLMLPYLTLAVPLFFSIITDAEPTGYDARGLLGACLTPAQIRRKRAIEQEEEEEWGLLQRATQVGGYVGEGLTILRNDAYAASRVLYRRAQSVGSGVQEGARDLLDSAEHLAAAVKIQALQRGRRARTLGARIKTEATKAPVLVAKAVGQGLGGSKRSAAAKAAKRDGRAGGKGGDAGMV